MKQAALRLDLPLALDTDGAVGQGIEPRNRDSRPARLALAIGTGLQASQGPLDLSQFLRFQLRKSGSDFLATGIECRISGIARSRRVLRLSQIFQFDTKPLPEFVPAGSESLMDSK